jgi:hypothetical protein
MYIFVLVLVSALIVVILFHFGFMFGLLALILALVGIPGIVIHRREAATAPEVGPEAESHGRGIMRLAHLVGIDLSGVALAVLTFFLIVLLARLAGGK